MYYIVESSKSFYEATFDLKPVIQRLGFEIQNTHDLSEILRRKGIEIDDDCQVFEVCNYRYKEKLLNLDMRLGLMMPWRISASGFSTSDELPFCASSQSTRWKFEPVWKSSAVETASG